jgi:hypothetical protein
MVRVPAAEGHAERGVAAVDDQPAVVVAADPEADLDHRAFEDRLLVVGVAGVDADARAGLEIVAVAERV